MRSLHDSGFTLIELLIVVAIIGILAGTVVVSLSGATSDADDASIELSVASLRAVALSEALSNPSGDDICDEVHKKVRAGADYISSSWTSSRDCDGDDVTGSGKICCVANGKEWVIWGGLSDFDAANTNTGDTSKDIFCTDDDGFLGPVDFAGTLTANGNSAAGFVTGNSSNYKCK